MEEDTFKEIEDIVNNSIYRNKSHFIELATKKLITEQKNGNKNL